MQNRFSRARTLAIAVTGATAASALAIPSAAAAPTGDQVVINEVYGGGGNSGAALTNDFIELYNPTDAEIDLTGMAVEYFSSSGNSGGSLTLNGTIPAQGHYLINMASGTGGQVTADADETGDTAMAGSNGSVQLQDTSGAAIDVVGYGNVAVSEGESTASLSNTTSAQRSPEGHDTDDNAADFEIGTPSPTNSAGQTFGADDIGDPGQPVDPPEPGEVIEIAEIQGTGDTTPLNGQTVTTQGVVTGVYREGGRNGFHLQTPGTGGREQNVGDASHGIFVYLGNSPNYPEIEDSVTVTGQAGEHFEVTQLSNASVTVETEDFESVTPVAIEHLPAGDTAREPYESMLVQPTGDYTVSNNYALNTFGELGLAPGDEPFRQATDVHAPDTDPNSPVQQLMRQQAEEEVLLDDGRTPNYMYSATDVPLPYIAQDGGQTIKPIRTGDTVGFQNPVVVHYSHGSWRFQPTTPITGENSAAELPITWENSRPAELGAMAEVAGDYSVASFNVLNYFTSLGEDEPGCDFYTDRYGNPVGTDWCDVRGAYSQEAFADQQTKIVNAINLLDASVVGLEEIENTAALTGDINDRDEALEHLVAELNRAAGEQKWDFVASPEQVGIDEDVIRVAFIYQPAQVTPVGDSRIFNDEAFTGDARQPLAQEFAPADATDAEQSQTFVAVTNHFKSKGSVTRGDADRGDGQGNNPNVRVAQSAALLEHLNQQDDWADKPTFILGDINSYTRETAMTVLENGGYTNIVQEYDAGETYQFSGRLGSLDHALGNDRAMELVVDADVWDINADEAVAFEYSRRNYNIVDFHDDSPFRSSDHDPIKVGFNLGEAGGEIPGEGGDDERGIASFEVNDAGHLIVTYTDGVTEDLGEVTEEAGQGGRSVASFEVNDAGHLIVTYTDGATEDLGEVTGAGGGNGGASPTGSGSSSGTLETVLAFTAGLGAMGGIVAWIVNTFFPQLRDGVVNRFNAIFG